MKNRSNSLLVVLFLWVVSVYTASLSKAKEPDELKKLRDQYFNAHVEAVMPLTDKYMIALGNLRGKLASAGDLEGALIVQSEEKSNNETKESEQPKQLVSLKRIYEKRRKEASDKVTKKYLVALKQLQTKLTKSGDLEAAMVVRDEYGAMARLMEDQADKLPTTREAFEKYLIGTAWVFVTSKTDNNPLVFKKGGKFSNKGLTCRYSVTGLRRVTIIWGGGVRVNCQISEDWKKMVELNAGRGTYRRVFR